MLDIAGDGEESVGAEEPRGDGAGGGGADGADAAPELTTGGAAASAAGDQSPATPPLELESYSSVEWKRQQAVRRRAG